MPDLLKEIEENTFLGNGPTVKELTAKAVEKGLAPRDILQKALMPAMDEVGRRMKDGEYYIPEVLISARSMKMALEVLRPLLADSKMKPLGTIALGTVKGDLHDIGKNVVGMMLEGAGFTVVDLGTDVSPQQFIAAVREHNAELVGMSALLTTTMVAMKETIEAFQQAGLRNRVKILVGGAPLTQAYAEQIGADGYAPDAASAMDIARQLVKP